MINERNEIINGQVEEINYRDEDSGFTVISIDYNDELLTVVGKFADVAVGERIKATGYFTTHTTYGTEFKAKFIERKPPDNSNAIFKYLASGVIKGIGPAMAKKIVEKFGDETIEIMENSPERLTEVKGITYKRCEKISEDIKRVFGIRAVMLYLANLGINSGEAVAVWKKWGAAAPNVISTNPFLLCGEDIGIGFEQADAIYSAMDMPEDSFIRIQGAVIYILTENMKNGHCCIPYDKLIQKTGELLEQNKETIEASVDTMLGNMELSEYVSTKKYIYLPKLFEAETFIASKIKLMLLMNMNNNEDIEKKIDNLQIRLGIEYAKQQREAITAAYTKGVMILTGGPGTGKTTTLNGIIKLLEDEGMKVALAAPTGRAAKRMSEVTGKDAKTIHRLLEVDFKDENGINNFKRNAKNPLPFDAVIVDEMSMVDVLLFESLLLALRMGCKLIMVGDSDQLPPVGAGNILKDLCDSKMITRVNLTEIFRQAAESLIVTNAHKIVNGEYPDLTVRNKDFFFMKRFDKIQTENLVCDLVETRLPKCYGFSPLWDIQVLSPQKNGTLGTKELNLALQQRLNPPDKSKIELKTPFILLREKDKVMQIRNNYDIIWEKNGEEGMGIFNGDIGIIETIDKGSKTIIINFDDRIAAYSFEMANELDLAYAVTIHKSQGNEFDAVIIPLMGSHSKLHFRNLLYTGITRAKKILIITGDEKTVREMVDNNRKTLRYTNLTEMLKEKD